MTKNEAIEAGKEAGTKQAEAMVNAEWLRAKVPAGASGIAVRDVAVAEAGPYASMASAERKVRSTPFFDAYAKAFAAIVVARWNELPEVKVEQRVRSFEWRVESALTSAQADLDKFSKNFSEDPAYAFEWADSAMKAAASRKVALHLQAIAKEHGLDEALNFAHQQALRGARYPSHSTSATTNEMAAYVTAAYAEFVEFVEGK